MPGDEQGSAPSRLVDPSRLALIPSPSIALTGLRRALIRSPSLVLVAPALGIFVFLGARSGGFYATTWYPSALFLLGLLAVALIVARRAPAPRLMWLATLAFAAYAGIGFLSIIWAAQKADAWDGANRTALYAVIFALFALWRIRARAALLLIGLYSLAVAGLALVELARAGAATHPQSFFLGGRFAAPIYYENADVCLWFLAYWPCVALGSRREVHPLLRGLLVAAAVVLGGAALLGQSRGWAFTAPLAAAAFLAIMPGRVRAALALALTLAAGAAFAGPALHVYDAAGTPAFPARVDDAVRAILLSALVAGAVAIIAAVVDRRLRLGARRAPRRAGVSVALPAVLAAALAGVIIFSHGRDPASAVTHAWKSFKATSSPVGGKARFAQSLGSHRYDFWRVAWGQFTAHPAVGIGADNYQEAYLLRRRSGEEPRYPHSIELRALSQTGVVGSIVLLGGFVAAAALASRALRLRAATAATATAAALGSFLYWILHGSVDWLWEFPALGAPAFALLGLGAGLAPRPASGRLEAWWRGPRGAALRSRLPVALRPRILASVAVAVVVCALAASFTFPWLSALESDAAIGVFSSKPATAFHRLRTAASLNPLSAQPQLLAGSIAVRLGRRPTAIHYFREALRRDHGSEYAHLELGLLLTAEHRRSEGMALLRQALALDPRDDLTRGALERIRRGRRVDIVALNRELAQRTAYRAR